MVNTEQIQLYHPIATRNSIFSS